MFGSVDWQLRISCYPLQVSLLTIPIFFHPNFDITAAARTLVMQKGLYLNNELVQDIHQTIEQSQLIDGRIAIIRAGRDKHLVLVVR
jgi:hypothetical protein